MISYTPIGEEVEYRLESEHMGNWGPEVYCYMLEDVPEIYSDWKRRFPNTNFRFVKVEKRLSVMAWGVALMAQI